MYVPALIGDVVVLTVTVTVWPAGIGTGPTTPGMTKLCASASVFLIVISTACPSRTNGTSPIGTDAAEGPSAGPGTSGLPAVWLRPKPRIQTGDPSAIVTYPSLIRSATLTAPEDAVAGAVDAARKTAAPPATETRPPAPAFRNVALLVFRPTGSAAASCAGACRASATHATETGTVTNNASRTSRTTASASGMCDDSVAPSTPAARGTPI